MTQVLDSSILGKITEADNLPSLPAVALQVLRLIREEDVAVTEIAHTIEKDPALSAKILKVVNSPLFGMPNNVSSLPQAMVVLGLRTLKIMVLSFSMVNELGSKRNDGFDHELFWKRSITTAVSSRLLAEKCDPGVREEAFAAGLLADLGILAAIECARAEYQPVLDAYHQEERSLQAVEFEKLGVTHAEISAALLSGWKLPEDLTNAARHHHDEEAPEVDANGHFLTRLVWAAAKVSDLFCNDIPLGDLPAVKDTIAQALNGAIKSGGMSISSEDLDTILDQVDQHVRQTAEQISLEIGATTSYEELRAAAMAQLAQLSMSAELDLAEASRKAAEAQQEIVTLSGEKEALAHTALTDELTQLHNRKAFNDHIERSLRQSTQTGHPLGLVMLDLDHFKSFNDTYGHLFGDEVLKVVGETLKKFEDDVRFAARYGGEEFAVVCSNSTLKDLAATAEEIREQIEAIELHYGSKLVQITASVGAAQADPANGEIVAEELIHKADCCLMNAKQAGRNRTIIAN